MRPKTKVVARSGVSVFYGKMDHASLYAMRFPDDPPDTLRGTASISFENCDPAIATLAGKRVIVAYAEKYDVIPK